jgi:hypothetical protein
LFLEQIRTDFKHRDSAGLVVALLAYPFVYGVAWIQRLSFKSVSLFFLPLLLLTNSDMIRPDLQLADRLREYLRDYLSWLKLAYSLVMIGMIAGSLLIANWAAQLYEYVRVHSSLPGQALLEYYVPTGNIVEVKAWQLATLLNACIFVYMFVFYVPRAIRRSKFEKPERFIPETKHFLYWVDVVTFILSAYSTVCGIAILLTYVLTHKFPVKEFQVFPEVV